MIAEPIQEVRRRGALEGKEPKIDPMWSADEDERRLAIIRRAAAGARQTLRAQRRL
jgi:hypothetical protein